MAIPDTATAGGLLILRIGIGASFLMHGLEKRMYWHQKPGAGGTRTLLRIYFFLTFAEPLAAMALFAGFLTRYAAVGTSIIMLGAIRTRIVVWKDKWGDDDGWEIDGIVLAASLALALTGAGTLSLDHVLGLV